MAFAHACEKPGSLAVTMVAIMPAKRVVERLMLKAMLSDKKVWAEEFLGDWVHNVGMRLCGRKAGYPPPLYTLYDVKVDAEENE